VENYSIIHKQKVIRAVNICVHKACWDSF